MALAGGRRAGKLQPVAPGTACHRAQFLQRSRRRTNDGVEALVGREAQRQRQLHPAPGAAGNSVHARGVPRSSSASTIDTEEPSPPDSGTTPWYRLLAV